MHKATQSGENDHAEPDEGVACHQRQKEDWYEAKSAFDPELRVGVEIVPLKVIEDGRDNETDEEIFEEGADHSSSSEGVGRALKPEMKTSSTSTPVGMETTG